MKTKLFCISYAGGSANAYAEWNKYISEDIELVPLELAGRGKRVGEPFYNDWNELSDDVYKNMVKNIDDNNYAIYGHSMGSWVVFELLKKIQKNYVKSPVAVYFSANMPPHFESIEEKISDLNDDKFAEKILNMGDTPREILFGDLRKFFLPILRSDYKLVEMYRHEEKNVSFDCDIHVLYGEKDNLKKSDLLEWKKYTNKNFYIQSFNGGHMFIKENVLEVTNYINHTIV